jgi:flagellar secretion chaperone FliS
MTGMAARALNSYSSLEVETGIAGASPERLIIMLYDGAVKAVFAAKTAIAQGDTPAKCTAISKAIAIIDEGLRCALNVEQGGDIAANLMALYDYMGNRLLFANLKSDPAALDEVARLLCELKQAWETLEQTSKPLQQPVGEAPERRGSTSFGKI